MPEIDFSAAYRDAAKGSTIKALQQRRAEAQAAMQVAQQPRQIGSPWQGAAQIGEVISGSIREGRLANQEASARQRFAQLLSGGLAPDEIGEALGLDPETGMKFVERNWATEDAAAKEKTRVSERQEDRARLVEDAIRRVEDERKTAELNRQGTAAIDREKVAAAAKAGHIDIVSGDEAVKRDPSLNPKGTYAFSADGTSFTDITPTVPETFGPLQTGTQLGLQGKAGEQLFQTSLTTNKTGQVGGQGTNISNVVGGGDKFADKSGEKAAERFDEIVKAGNEVQPFLANLRIVADLGKRIGTGKEAELKAQLGPWAEAVGIDVAGLGEAQAYNAIIDKMAPNMRVANAGPSSDFDARQFLSSLPALGRTPEGNKIINDTFEALGQHKMAAAEIAAQAQSGRMTWQEAEMQIRALPNPYETFKKMSAGGEATVPPPPTGGTTGGTGTETGAPTMQPGDTEGDTGTDDAGNGWIVRGGQWVRR